MVDAVRHYTRPLREAEVDTVILGCTHYPLIRPLLQRMLGRGVEIVSSGDAIARQVEHVLGSRGLGNPSTVEGDVPVPDAPATPRRCARPARASCSCRSARSSTSRCRTELAVGDRDDECQRARAAAARPTSCGRSTIEPGFVRTATGSALITCGGTRVICTASRPGVRAALAGRARAAGG